MLKFEHSMVSRIMEMVIDMAEIMITMETMEMEISIDLLRCTALFRPTKLTSSQEEKLR